MTFDDVEVARRAYFEKTQAASKKRKKFITIACAPVFAIDLLILILNFQDIIKIFSETISVASIMFIVVPVIVVILSELVFIVIAAYLFTGGNNFTEEYIAYRRAYKSYFITRQLASVFTELEYDHQRGLDRQFLDETCLIYTGDRYRSNDLVKGKYREVGFIQADVHIEAKREEKDDQGHIRTHYETVFKGRYLIFEFPKKFDFKMVVSFNGYDRAYVNPRTGRGLGRVEMESPGFNKRFLVYAEDGFEAFYILDPAFMERLEKLGQKYHNQLALYFSDNKLYIGINDHGDTFEPPAPATPIDEVAETAKVLGEINLNTDLVDGLKLSK